MSFLVITAVSLGLFIGLKADRLMLFTVVAAGLAAGLAMTLFAGFAPAGAFDGLFNFAASVLAGFLTGTILRRPLFQAIWRRLVQSRLRTDHLMVSWPF